MKRLNYFLPLCLTLITVLIILCALILHHFFPAMPGSRFISSLITIPQICLLWASITVYLSSAKRDKKVFFWFLIAIIALTMNGLNFYYFIYIKKYSITKIPFYLFLSYYVPFIIWLTSAIVFLSKILVPRILRIKNFFKILFMFFIFNFIVMFLFFSSLKDEFLVLSGVVVSQAIACTYKLVLFDLGMLCLICVEDAGMLVLLSGISMLISADFLFNYASVAKAGNVLVYGELVWLVATFLMFAGALIIIKRESYNLEGSFRRTNAIKSHLIFWTFGVSIVSFILFFVAAYFFSLINKVVFAGLPFFIMTYSVILVILSVFMGKYFETPFKKLAFNIENFMLSKSKIEENFSIEEFAYLQKFLLNMFEVNEEKDRIRKELGTITVQVAHDIRSPLATINAVVKETNEIQEQKRIILRNATQQLNDIANILLVRYRSGVDSSSVESSSSKESEVIAVLLDLIISEKRLQYKHLPITIEFIVSMDSYGVFAQVVVSDFKRVISNLINNAIEAINGRGEIIVRLSTTESSVDIEISDNGVGMSSGLIMKVFDGSISSNKKDGSGVGLLSSRNLIESWGGMFNITSELNVGTTVHLGFVRLKPATWFASELSFIAGSKVVILDDDQSIHDLWESRFSNEISGAKLQLIHFYHAEELIHYDLNKLSSAYFLCDYELIGQEKTGLDVIEQLNLGKKAILVTSRYDDRDIRSRCARLDLKILPKNYAAYVPIHVGKDVSEIIFLNVKEPDLVLIDNDPLVITTWKFIGKKRNKKILAFDSFVCAEKEIEKLPRTVPIYIDSDLGTEIPGEEYAKILYEQGFVNIYLATGHRSSRFKSMDWIKGIVGKEPPF